MNLKLQEGSRSKIFAAILFIIIALFVGRLFYLQVIQHGYYSNIANSEQLKRLTIPAKRGMIYALDNGNPVPIVLNQTVYTVFADPQMTEDDDKIVETINKVAGGNARSGLSDLLSKKSSRYQILATHITRSQADMIKEEKLKGVGFQESTQRVYPENQLASQVLGFVDYSGTGRYGVEGALNERLNGTDGLLQSVTDVSDVPLTIGDRNINQPAVDGDNVVLSIDRNIQAYTEQALIRAAERTGATDLSAVVMDPQTGQVMAMANLPAYSPAEFNKVSDASLFNNKVISYAFEPASTIKLFTFSTSVDKGVLKPSDTYYNSDSVRVEDITIHNATKGHTGNISFQTSLNHSLNTGSVEAFYRLGGGKSITRSARDTIYDYFYNKFRLGQKTGIELAGEVSGNVISPEKLEGNAVRYATMSFGQGLYPTMIQTVAGMGAIVNGGKYISPSIVAGVVDKDGNFVANEANQGEQIISKSTADTIKEMAHAGRSGFYSHLDKPGYNVGGKTGTAETVKDGSYVKTETVANYLGYGGNETPRYVIMVRVAGENMQLSGALHAMPVFTDISNWLIDYLRIPPKG